MNTLEQITAELELVNVMDCINMNITNPGSCKMEPREVLSNLSNVFELLKAYQRGYNDSQSRNHSLERQIMELKYKLEKTNNLLKNSNQ